MMLLPGSLGAVTCKCVYPLTVKLRFDNASTTFPSLSAEFQHELASQLNLIDVQVLVSYFKFGVNTSFAVLAATKNNPLNTEADIGPISGKSFSASTIAGINSTLWSHAAQFNKTYFGNYTVLSVTTPYLPPPAPPPPNPPPPPPPGKGRSCYQVNVHMSKGHSCDCVGVLGSLSCNHEHNRRH